MRRVLSRLPMLSVESPRNRIPMAAVSLSEAAIPRGTAPSTTCQVKRSHRSTCAVMALRRTPSCQLADYANAMEDGHEVTTTSRMQHRGAGLRADSCARDDRARRRTAARGGGPLSLCQRVLQDQEPRHLPSRSAVFGGGMLQRRPGRQHLGSSCRVFVLARRLHRTVPAGGSVPVQTK